MIPRLLGSLPDDAQARILARWRPRPAPKRRDPALLWCGHPARDAITDGDATYCPHCDGDDAPEVP